MNILSNFANKIPELYLKATLDEKRLILSTIIEKILYDEDSNTLQVKLKLVFEQLRQRKIQNNKTFLVNTNSLTGTLESYSEKAIQADDENQIDLNKIIDYGTHKNQRQHRTEPYKACYKKLNVVKVTTLEPFDTNKISPNNSANNLYCELISSVKQSTQEYYNMRMALGLECV